MSVWGGERTRRILVIVGTDVHPFARLTEWADGWARSHPDDDVLVQHGYSPAPRVARGVEMFTPSELEAALTEADVVISHGGPGTISTVRASGLLPIVLARDPEYGEHVDGHQLRFATWAGARGLAAVVEGEGALDAAVEAGCSAVRSAAGPAPQVEVSVRTLGENILAVLRDGPRRRRVPMLRRSVRKQ